MVDVCKKELENTLNKIEMRDFPGGALVKNPLAKAQVQALDQ